MLPSHISPETIMGYDSLLDLLSDLSKRLTLMDRDILLPILEKLLNEVIQSSRRKTIEEMLQILPGFEEYGSETEVNLIERRETKEVDLSTMDEGLLRRRGETERPGYVVGLVQNIRKI